MYISIFKFHELLIIIESYYYSYSTEKYYNPTFVDSPAADLKSKPNLIDYIIITCKGNIAGSVK